MNDNNKQNHTKAVREGLESLQECQEQHRLKQIREAMRAPLESLQNCQKQYTMEQITEQINDQTDSKVPPEDVRTEIVEIINDEEGQLLYSPPCEGEQQSKDEDEDEELINRLIDYRVVLLGFGILGVLLTSAPLLEPLPLGLTPLLTLLTGVVLILAGGGVGALNTGWTVIVAPLNTGWTGRVVALLVALLVLLVLLVSLAWVWAPQQTSESLESVVASPQISESLASSLLLSSGAFYATIGVYLFSIANTCYSIGADKGNKELYDTGTEISRAGCLVSGGGAVSLTVGIFITIFNFSLPHYSWLKTGVLFGSVLVSQALILRGLWKHKKQHKWFQDLREDEFSEEHSGE